MNTFPVEITLRNLPESLAIEHNIKKKAEKLKQYCHRIEFCKVVVGYVQKKHAQGKLYDTHIEVGVPGKRIAVTRQKDEDLYVAIRDAFSAMYRRLQRYASVLQGHVKRHHPVLFGYVSRKFEDYGFIETEQGMEYYFHASHVLHWGFDRLQPGECVTFMDNGLIGDTFQATHVSGIEAARMTMAA